MKVRSANWAAALELWKCPTKASNSRPAGTCDPCGQVGGAHGKLGQLLLWTLRRCRTKSRHVAGCTMHVFAVLQSFDGNWYHMHCRGNTRGEWGCNVHVIAHAAVCMQVPQQGAVTCGFKLYQRCLWRTAARLGACQAIGSLLPQPYLCSTSALSERSILTYISTSVICIITAQLEVLCDALRSDHSV
jgi:hypothetical protein